MVEKRVESVYELHEQPQSVRDKGAKLAYQNALRHVKAARILADNSDYGNGISHLVLGIEEAMKALKLFSWRFAAQFSVPESPKLLKELFRKHESKQSPFLLVVLMIEVFKTTNPLFSKNKKSAVRNLMNLLGTHSKSKNSVMDRVLRELKRMNDSKKDGFYVDFRNHTWVDPTKKKKTDYTRLEKIVTPYIEVFGDIFSLSNKEWEENIKLMEKILPGKKGISFLKSKSSDRLQGDGMQGAPS